MPQAGSDGGTRYQATPPDRPAAVVVSHLTKNFAGRCVVDDVSFHVDPGQTLCIVGPSGAGKSTLLRCVNYLEKPSSGTVTVDGVLIGYEPKPDHLLELRDSAIARQRASIGMVFQHFNLFANKSAIDNVMEGPLQVQHKARSVAVEQAAALLNRVGLGPRARAMPHELSGGEQQRVAIARALAMQPRLMLFDEPTSALDPEFVGEVLSVIQELTLEGMTSIIVTHEIAFAREVADQAIFMDQGRIIERGPARQVLSSPSETRTQDFIARVL